jgi:Putative MetA-pathway of phenol degradation
LAEVQRIAKFLEPGDRANALPACQRTPRSPAEYIGMGIRWILRIIPVLLVHALVISVAFADQGNSGNGENATDPTAADAKDKSGYTLFNPTPNEYMREMSADRPDKTDSPFTVDAGHFQVEMDFANFTYDVPNSERGNVKSKSYQTAPMNLKVGVLNNVDFQLVLFPWQWERIEDRTARTIERNSGFGDITPRVKVNFIGNDGGFFALGLIPFVKLPASQDHLGNGAVEGGLGIPYAFDIPNWDVSFQTTFSCNRNDVGNGYHAEFANSVSIGHAVIGKLSYSVEFFSSVSTERNSNWIGTFDTWFTYQVSKNLRLDAGIYIGVTGSADDWHPWTGMTWRY